MDIIRRNNIIFLTTLILINFGSFFRYGYLRIVTVLIIIFTGKVFEFIVSKISKDNKNYAPMWILLLTPLILPPTLPLYMILTSLIFGLLIGIVFFGGSGREIVSPLPLIWGFASISFSVIYNRSWAEPYTNLIIDVANGDVFSPIFTHPIEYMREIDIPIFDFIAGHVPSTPGASMPILLLVLGIVLMIFKITDLKVAIIFLLSSIIISTLFVHGNLADSLRYLITGNFLIIALIILPLKTLAPKTTAGSYIIGFLGGIVLITINTFSSHLDGSMFTVLILNIFAPIIDDGVLRFKAKRRSRYA